LPVVVGTLLRFGVLPRDSNKACADILRLRKRDLLGCRHGRKLIG
jgi:hypothetical protein